MTSILATSVALGDTLHTVCQTSGFPWQTVLSVIAVLISLLMFIVAWLTFREHNRPYITLHAEIKDGYGVCLVIKNSGNRAAYNVSVNTDVPLESVFYSQNPNYKLPFVTEKIHHFIGPDQSLSSFFDDLSWRYSAAYQKPRDKYAITIKYRHKKRKFIDKYQFDLSYLEFMPWGKPRDPIEDISRVLSKISDQLPGGWIHLFRNWDSLYGIKQNQEDAKDNAEGLVGNEDSEHEQK